MSEAANDASRAFDEDYVSPLEGRIGAIRATILSNAKAGGWTVDEDRLDDRHIVRRMVLKRCVFGVDRNPMAVELAKVSPWLHTFTVGAPLSFLDHHLRCGDSLFGSWVAGAIGKAGLFLHEPMQAALASASRMGEIEHLTDADIAEAHRSSALFGEVPDLTRPLDAFLSLVHAFGWFDLRGERGQAFDSFLDGFYGDPVGIAIGNPAAPPPAIGRNSEARVRKTFETFQEILDEALAAVREERFVNWQVSFPGVWTDWRKKDPRGGFDAVIGNPPWDRMRLEQVQWFAHRSPEIAHRTKAADRKRMIGELGDGHPLAVAYAKAAHTAETAQRLARGGDYPLLSGGGTNLYSLFVERAMTLARSDGMVGLVVPSGIAADRTAARFFRTVSTTGRLKALYDFENGRSGSSEEPFFRDVHRSFKFSIFVAGRREGAFPKARCAFYVRDMAELEDPERRFDLTPEDFARVNPNTATAPVFLTRRDAALTTAIQCLPENPVFFR